MQVGKGVDANFLILAGDDAVTKPGSISIFLKIEAQGANGVQPSILQTQNRKSIMKNS
jgi:hypothetical protein